MNLLSIIAIFSFIGVLILESVTLMAGIPLVMDNIERPRISTESDIIIPFSGCNESKAISSFSIEPQVNGSFYTLDNHLIFTPSNGLKDGEEYTLTYGCENKSITFVAERPSNNASRVDYTLVSGFYHKIVIAFNMDVNHKDIERNISFKPDLSFSSYWYGNTLVIEPQNATSMSYEVKIDGSTEINGKNYTVNFQTTYYPGYGILDMQGDSAIPQKESTWLFLIIPPGLPLPVSRISGNAFAGYFLFIVSAILLSLGYISLKEGRQIIRSSADSLKKFRLKVPAENSLFEIAALFFATISFSVIFYYFIMLFNPNPTVPQFGKMPLWEQLYEFARAGVWEELITRIPFIGLILLLVHAVKGEREAPIYRYIVGGGFKTDRTVLILIFICAFMFGFVHMLGGWDMFKILPAMVGGLAMGYLYTKWGIWASITLHFATDYLSMPSMFFNSRLMEASINLFLLGSVFIGIYFFYLYSRAFLVHIRKKKPVYNQPQRHGQNYPQYPYPQHPQNYPPQYPYPQYQQAYIPQYPQQPYSQPSQNYPPQRPDIPYAPYPYRCYVCGNTQAEYMGNGILRCTRCGALSRIPPQPPMV